jgi:hypothetical protein
MAKILGSKFITHFSSTSRVLARARRRA